MQNEKDTIKKIFSILPAEKLQENKPFEADCEIIRDGDKYLLFTTDDYSKEDRIRENDPFTLGYNLAVASFSDILACGGTPKYYAHSIVVCEKWDQSFIEKFALGIKKVLEIYNTSFIGGDFGCGSDWHYTTSIIGENDKILMRSGAKQGDSIYVSGLVGAGNLEAALSIYSENKLLAPVLNQYKTEFNIRFNESRLIRNYATSCIDTSDGLCRSLNNIADINNSGFEVNNVPYHKTALLAAKLLDQPKEMLMLGECGEYELLFTVSPEREADFQREAEKEKFSFYKIGKICQNGVRKLTEANKSLDLNTFNISAREYKDINDYLGFLKEKLKTSWNENA